MRVPGPEERDEHPALVHAVDRRRDGQAEQEAEQVGEEDEVGEGVLNPNEEGRGPGSLLLTAGS